ncbi:mandelate racemase/muconate lactonizing enzyme family protein [Pelagibacterium sp. 26DY04]|uniref:mandelate racemase/muconate lactonizing enzyme family protein n=1 Tax=Pelagibacterium sp. 26DY04 TaxID=2967130 RepID=UPI0028160FC0|nr:mandelate racemase/muconate lactonizing enzyme family protein [Pelagibacterium sp. 26DY04]WMT85916.1 mandelate racemase/muconate lactonizing enzyme family protein [Pelagibacterium sp. 26DY04]
MRINSYRITRFQFRRDRVIGDSQVRAEDVNVAALELIADTGAVGLGFIQTLFTPLPSQAEMERIFETEVWPTLEGASPLGLVHRVTRPRGGNQRAFGLPVHEALQVALWDLVGKEAGMPLWEVLGGSRDRVKAYASGLDFHLSDEAFVELFGHADAIGYDTFKIKVGHSDFERDLHRLDLLKKTVRPGARFMIDANEAWGAKEALNKIEAIERAGFALVWVEDPILRTDFAGLKMLCASTPNTMINSGEYLDASGKRALMSAGATDIVNVHGQITDVMRIGWFAADIGVPVSVGNTFLEVGIQAAVALPEVEWIEYSFQNFDHLVEEPIEIRDGYAYAPKRPGHGLVLSEVARAEWARPEIVSEDQLGEAPANPRVGRPAPVRSLGTA